MFKGDLYGTGVSHETKRLSLNKKHHNYNVFTPKLRVRFAGN